MSDPAYSWIVNAKALIVYPIIFWLHLIDIFLKTRYTSLIKSHRGLIMRVDIKYYNKPEWIAPFDVNPNIPLIFRFLKTEFCISGPILLQTRITITFYQNEIFMGKDYLGQQMVGCFGRSIRGHHFIEVSWNRKHERIRDGIILHELAHVGFYIATFGMKVFSDVRMNSSDGIVRGLSVDNEEDICWKLEKKIDSYYPILLIELREHEWSTKYENCRQTNLFK